MPQERSPREPYGRDGDRPTRPALAPRGAPAQASSAIVPAGPAGPRQGAARRARSGGSVETIVAALKSNPALRERIVHWQELPAREAQLRDLPPALDPRLARLF